MEDGFRHALDSVISAFLPESQFARNDAAQPAKEPWQMSRKHFDGSYMQHSVLRPEAKPEEVESGIRQDGFSQGIGPNVTLPTAGTPTDIMQKNYGTRAGVPVIAVPRLHTEQGGNGARVKTGWKFEGGHIGVPESDYEPLHRIVVRTALAAGKPVPPEVLAEYPDLANPKPTPVAEFARKKPALCQTALNHRNDIHQRESAQYDRNHTGEFSRVGPNDTEMWSGPSMIAADATNAAHISSKAAGGEGHRLSSIVHKQVGSRMLSGPPSAKSHRSAANNHELVASEHEKASSSSNGDEQKLHIASAYLHRKAAQLHHIAESSLTTSEFGRKPATGQTAFNWDEESHPRESAEHDGKRPGEFAPKEGSKGSREIDEPETPIEASNSIDPRVGTHLEQDKPKPVDDALWTTNKRKSSTGDAGPQGEWPSLTLAGETKAFNVANKTKLTERQYAALSKLNALGGSAAIEERRGAKIYPKNEDLANTLFDLVPTGLVESTYSDPNKQGDGRGYAITSKGNEHLDNGHKEGDRLLERVKAAHFFNEDGFAKVAGEEDDSVHNRPQPPGLEKEKKSGDFANDTSVSNVKGGKGRFSGCKTIGEMRERLRGGERIVFKKYHPGWQVEVHGTRAGKDTFVASAAPDESSNDTAPPISKELAEKYPSLLDGQARPSAQPSQDQPAAEETPRQRANRRMFEDDIKAIYRNAGDAATVHGNAETASQIAKLTGAKTIDAGKEFENALKSEVEGVGETMDSFHEAMKDGRRGSASRLAEKAWKSIADKINADPDKLVVHGIDNLPQMGVENPLQHLKGAGFRDSGRDGESATIVVGKDSGIKPPSGRRLITQEADPKVEANAAMRDAQIAKERAEREEAEAPAKAREANRQKAADEAANQDRKEEADRSSGIAQEVRSKMMATVDKMKPKEGFTVPKKITNKFRSELENHIALATDVRNQALLSEAADRWLSVHAPSSEGKSADASPSPQKPAGSNQAAGEPITRKEKLPGTLDMAHRIVNAENEFVSSVVEQFGVTPEQAEKVLSVYRKAKAVKLDAVGGVYRLTHGAFWEKSAIDNAISAADTKQQNKKTTVTGGFSHESQARAVEKNRAEADERQRRRQNEFSRAACDCRAHLVTAIHTALNFDGKHKADDSIARSIPEDPAQIDPHVAEVLRELANTSPDIQKALGEYLAS